AVGKPGELDVVQATVPRPAVQPFGVQEAVDCVGVRSTGMQDLPQGAEPDVVPAPAERARAVAGGKRGRVVEEGELGEAARLQEGRAPPTAELEAARDPASAGVAPADTAFAVVQAAAIAVDEPAAGRGDELAERRDPVLQRHLAWSVSRGYRRARPA